MHRQINRSRCFIKSGKIKGYFAYRLPGENAPKFFRGDFVKTLQKLVLGDNEIVIHSFLGDEVYLVKNLTVISQKEIDLSLSDSGENKIWNKSEYLDAFEKIQKELNSGRFQKLVLSRIKKVTTEKTGPAIFNELNLNYKNTFNYFFSSPETGTWIGASPELLLKSEKDNISTVSLAGTKPADGFSEWTPKEREEQKFVTDFILSAFAKNKIKDIIVTATYTSKAGPVEHLKSDLSGKTDNINQLYSLLKNIHPTPATCGIPQAEAMKKIAEIESHHRKFYTGYIGIFANNVHHFFVNLRCMELQKGHALLFVGGGITTASVGEREWLETEKKAETIIRVL